jgi:hypothetical protein
VTNLYVLTVRAAGWQSWLTCYSVDPMAYGSKLSMDNFLIQTSCV